MKTNFGIDSGFKLVNTTISDEDFIFSNGESFIIYDLETVVLVETITDLLDIYEAICVDSMNTSYLIEYEIEKSKAEAEFNKNYR